MKGIRVSITLIAVLVATGCSGGLNTNPASYVSDLVTYGEGHEAFVCYFVLKDASGTETACDGRYTLKVEDDRGVIFTQTRTISSASFQRATVGQGAFERTRLLYYIGRIQYSAFRRDPEGFSGTVSIKFETGGRTLYGEEMLLFD